MYSNKKYGHVISLGYNCEVSFQFFKKYHFVESSLFAWVNCHDCQHMIKVLQNLSSLTSKGFVFDGFMYRDIATDILFHAKEDKGESDEEKRQELASRISYLREKFLKTASDGKKNLYIFKYPSCDKKEDVVRKEILALFNVLKSLVKNYFDLLIIFEKQAYSKINIDNPNIFIEYVNYFTPENAVTTKPYDKKGYGKIFSKYKPDFKLPHQKAFKFEDTDNLEKTSGLLKVKKDMIIVRVDGGICSQINFYAVGSYLAKKGYTVKYDLSWFKENGKDLDGRFVRNFDLLKAFPSLHFQQATPAEIKYYTKKFPKKTNELTEFKPPLYLGGYPSGLDFLIKERKEFIQKFLPTDIFTVSDLLKDIHAHSSCAIHVRRGDVVGNSKNHIYGQSCSREYFLNAIRILLALEKKLKFYFFSDEMDWVRKNIVSFLDSGIEFCMCDLNGSDKGYIDLYLISQCNHIIASKGSFGAFGRILSNNNGWFIGTLKSKYLATYFDKCMFLSQDKEIFIQHSEAFESKKIGTRIKKILISCIPYKPLRKKLRRKCHVK